MNESNSGYLNYDNYYNSFQFSDIPVTINDSLQSNYINSIHDELSDQLPASVNSNIFPFVQIHTINAQPTNNNFGNIFRREQNSNKIKSEPIKSEQNDGNQNSLNAQANPNCGQEHRVGVGVGNENLQLINSQHTQERCPLSKSSKQGENVNIFKCKKCLFLSISENILEKHYATEHINNIYNSGDCESNELSGKRRHVSCPGCENIFYTKNSIKIHLEFDHMMMEEELKLVMRDIFKENEQQLDQQKKSRIYLRNVECLIEPRSEQVEQICDSNNYPSIFENGNPSLIDLINVENDQIVTTSNILTSSSLSLNKMKQKISIKSVDVLCEPSLVQKDNNFNNNFNNQQFYDNSGFSESTYNNQTTNVSSFHSEKLIEKPSRPKIYIKNVDILKEPIFLSPNNVTNILDINDDLHFNMFQMPNLPSVASSDELRSSYNTTPHEQQNSFESSSTPDGFSYDETNNFHTDSAPFTNDNTFQTTSDFLEKPKKKIFIKNASEILKPLGEYVDNVSSIPKRTTNYIHLRTVDELNLMNKKEVQNLITPNLDPISTTPDTIHNSSENSKNSDSGGMCGNFAMLPSDINVFGEKPVEYSEIERARQNTWSNEYFFDGLQNIIDSSSSPVCGDQKNSHFDLNTPQVTTSTIHETEQENDPEILFVCAQELINANQDNNTEKNIKSVNDFDSNINVLATIESESVTSNTVENVNEPQLTELESSTSLSAFSNPVVQPSEKGRIYVADNLMAETNKSEELITGKKSNRGRPIGSNRLGITRAKKVIGSSADLDLDIKCDSVGCTFRFKKAETLVYHKKCHTSGLQRMKCPECEFTNFSTWNTLHTHLWRSHKIDMELYSCDRCNFKTPIYSRLANTHSKIHSDERNYKCDQCEKAFKNSKQLKNHRRYHRTATTPTNEIHKCSVCGLAFSHIRSLKEHTCKENDESKQQFQCKICEKVLSSKSALKLHALTHEIASKFKCENCFYVTNDHNAIRRHKMTHDRNKMYQCPHCDYKSIQSTTYQNHIQQKHPDAADFIILKCTSCSFSTINRALFNVHLAKHDNRSTTSSGSSSANCTDKNEQTSTIDSVSDQQSIATMTMTATTTTTTPSVGHLTYSEPTDHQSNQNSRTETDDRQPKNKIQVKRDLVLTDFSNVRNAIVLQNCDDSITRN